MTTPTDSRSATGKCLHGPDEMCANCDPDEPLKQLGVSLPFSADRIAGRVRWPETRTRSEKAHRNEIIEEVAKSIEAAPLTYAGPDPHVASDLRYLIVASIRDLKNAAPQVAGSSASTGVDGEGEVSRFSEGLHGGEPLSQITSSALPAAAAPSRVTNEQSDLSTTVCQGDKTVHNSGLGALCPSGSYCSKNPPCASPDKCTRTRSSTSHLEQELGLERESHEVTKRMVDDRDDTIETLKPLADLWRHWSKRVLDLPDHNFPTASTFAHLREAMREGAALPLSASSNPTGPLKLDTDREVFFYEQDHYYLSNFSAFNVRWAGIDFPTSEHAYHWYRFNGVANLHQEAILATRSAHDAFRYAQENKRHQRPEWDEVKVGVMRDILRAKVEQHEYVRRKLLQTGDRTLIENSWRDPFWGWGENRDGKNMLGVLWMEVRAEIRAADSLVPTKEK